MIITLTDSAKSQLLEEGGTYTLSITDGCCGKSFDLQPQKAVTTDKRFVEIDGVRFYVDAETERIAPEVTFDHPGPIEGYMITNVKALGGCGCGKSFFIAE